MMTRRSLLLIVDDNALNRKILSRYLTRRGFEVECVESGELALDAIARRKPDLVLLDVLMEGMSGLDVLRQVRTTMSPSELPIIMATARDGSSDVVEAHEAGANDYVTKPIDLAVLGARISTHLQLKDANERIRNLAQRLELRNQFIRETFGRYLTDQVVEELLATPEGLALGGASRTVTILVSDLRGFSSLSERLTPPQVVNLLNYYLGAMTEIILRHGGTIDEFIGDSILVIFGAPTAHPDHATRAMACALEMQLAMRSINQHFAEQGLPEIEMGVGINTGEVVVGNIGSDRRAKYGVVGRHVNLTTRIEALTVGGQILISESTRDAVGPSLRIKRTLEVSLKGISQRMRIYEACGIDGAYQLELPSGDAPLCTLREPLRVEISALNGVEVPAGQSQAELSALSDKEAVLSSSASLTLLSMILLHFRDAKGIPLEEPLYGKVLSALPDGSYSMRFTSVPPSVQRLLSSVLSKVNARQ